MNYLYNEQDRRIMIENFLKNNPMPISTGKILDIENDKPESYDVYEMPMYFFVHNWRNGRHFIEAQKELLSLNLEKNKLDPVKYNELIEKMLWDSKIDTNNVTKENLKKFSQQEPIIATKSGIIIDGNRRFMLLKRIWKEQKLSFIEQKLKVIILKKDFSDNELNSLETKIQFRKEGKVDYDPINKKIKIFNMYEDLLNSKNLVNKNEKLKFHVSPEILKEISDNTGESQSEIKKYLQIISFVKWFLDSKDASGYLNLFLNKDEQLKNLFASVKKINESKKFSETKMWFDGDKNIENMFIDASMYQILHKVKAVGSFRDIMVSKNNWSVLRYKDLFEKWYKQTIEIVGNVIFKFDVENREKREKLEELNKNIIREIEDREREELKNLREENNLKDSSEIINDMQIENAINFFYKRLEYFDSIEVLSDFNKNKLEEISKVINKILLK